MEIRIATLSDADCIHDIYAPYVKDTNITFEYTVPSVEEMKQRIEKTLKDYPYLVAIENHRIVGYAYASRYRGRKAYDWDSELSVYVEQGYQGHGVGRKLYQVLFQLLEKQNVKNVYACITFPNEKSEKLHSFFGFRMIGTFTRSGYKFEKWHDIIWMEKALGDYQQVQNIISFSMLEEAEIKSCLNN